MRADDTQRQALAEYLVESGVESVGKWTANRYGLNLAVGNSTLVVSGTQVRIVYSRYNTARANVERALEVAQQYAAELLQADVLEALNAVGARVSNVRLSEQGALLFSANF